jgi:hypothetical protein
MKITVVGDSFSSDNKNGSWIELLSKTHELKNYSLRGICQYRIFDILTKNLLEIQKSDAVIIWHTNPDRVYVNNETPFPTRRLSSHPYADIVAADSLTTLDKEWRSIIKNYYKVFYNQEQQLVYYELMFEKIKALLVQKKVIHCSGFNLPTIPDIKSFDYLLTSNPGEINHYDLLGNQEVFNYINSKL